MFHRRWSLPGAAAGPTGAWRFGPDPDPAFPRCPTAGLPEAVPQEEALDQVETTARAMCQADGQDPDKPTPAPDASRTADDGLPPATPRPRWRAYEAQARRLVEAQAAMLAGR